MACSGRRRGLGPIDQPSFQPVTLNVLPALPIVIVLSHMLGKVANKKERKYLRTNHYCYHCISITIINSTLNHNPIIH